MRMADLKYQAVRHDHAEFLAKAKKRAGFAEAYDELALEYALASQMLKARAKAGLTQDAVAERMGTSKSAISRLESAGRHAPSLATLKKYAAAAGCGLRAASCRSSWCSRSRFDDFRAGKKQDLTLMDCTPGPRIRWCRPGSLRPTCRCIW